MTQTLERPAILPTQWDKPEAYLDHIVDLNKMVPEVPKKKWRNRWRNGAIEAVTVWAGSIKPCQPSQPGEEYWSREVFLTKEEAVGDIVKLLSRAADDCQFWLGAFEVEE